MTWAALPTYVTHAAAPVQWPSAPVTSLAVSESVEELVRALINDREAVRDKLHGELKSLRGIIAAAKAGSTGCGAALPELFALQDQLRAEVGNESKVLIALYARIDEYSAAIKTEPPPLAPRRRRGRR